MFICGASLLASPRSGKILMVLMCIALCQKLWLSRYSHCCVTRCAPSFVPWRLRTTEPCGDQWFLWWPDRHFHHLMFLYWFLMSDDFDHVFFDTFLWSPTVSVGCWILRCQVLLCMLTALAVMLLSEIKGLHLDRGDVAGAHWHRGWVKLAMKLPYDSGNNGSGYIHIWVTMFFWNKHPLASYFEVPRVSGFLTHKHILCDSMSPICSNQSMCFLLHPWLDFTEGSISPQLAQ